MPIKPFEFSEENAIDILGDSTRRILEGEARKFADGGLKPRSLFKNPRTFWEYIIIEHKKIVWRAAYFKRLARIKRKKNAN